MGNLRRRPDREQSGPPVGDAPSRLKAAVCRTLGPVAVLQDKGRLPESPLHVPQPLLHPQGHVAFFVDLRRVFFQSIDRVEDCRELLVVNLDEGEGLRRSFLIDRSHRSHFVTDKPHLLLLQGQLVRQFPNGRELDPGGIGRGNDRLYPRQSSGL